MAPLTVYFAGALFTHKDLLGNARLAAAITACSQGQYTCVLPQDLEQTTRRAVDIRNQDLRQVMTCDLVLCNFDGTELDSGTVVEFMFAKCLDIPSVILRSDFRAAGDQDKAGDAWNLMCSFYPRTATIQVHAMAWYQEVRQDGGSFEDMTARLYTRLATAILDQLDAVRRLPPVLTGSHADLERLYQWALRFPGSGFAETCAEPGFLARLIARKRRQGLL